MNNSLEYFILHWLGTFLRGHSQVYHSYGTFSRGHSWRGHPWEGNSWGGDSWGGWAFKRFWIWFKTVSKWQKFFKSLSVSTLSKAPVYQPAAPFPSLFCFYFLAIFPPMSNKKTFMQSRFVNGVRINELMRYRAAINIWFLSFWAMMKCFINK